MLPNVAIYRLQNDDTQKVIAVCTLMGSEVKCEGEKSICEALAREGILDYSRPKPKRLYPSDGLKFLEQLPNHFRSGYLMASLHQ